MNTTANTIQHLRRYTNLASTMDILIHKRLTLLNPKNWPDKNDSTFLEHYKKESSLQTLLAICFTTAPETYHHWRSYSYGSDGICIEFDCTGFLDRLDQQEPCVVHGKVVYKEIGELESAFPTLQELPFVKRHPYRGEEEYRIIYKSSRKSEQSHHLPIEHNMIRRIKLSPWLHASLVNSVKYGLKCLAPNHEIEVYQSKLIDYPRWKSALKRGQTN